MNTLYGEYNSSIGFLKEMLRYECGFTEEEMQLNIDEIHNNITEFRSETQTHLEYLSERIEVVLRANQKIVARSEIKRIQRTFKGVSNEQIHKFLLQRDFGDSLQKMSEELLEVGVIHKEFYEESTRDLRQKNGQIHTLQRDIENLEKQLLFKEKTLGSGSSEGNIVIPIKVGPKINFVGVISKFQAGSSGARSINEKISKIKGRLDTIFSKEPNSENQEELREMLSKVDKLSGVPEVAEEIIEVKRLIQKALSYSQFTAKQDGELGKSESIPLLPYIEKDIPIDLLDNNSPAREYITSLFEKGLSHSLSSTKVNGESTHGDGSFVTKILRPFLQALKNQVFMSSSVDITHVSWSKIADEYERQVSDTDNARRLFVGILKKFQENGHFFEIFSLHFLEAIDEFSKSNYYKDNKQALRNVKDFLEKNLPPGV